MIGGVDMERGTVTSGGRGYYLMGPAVCLQQALIQLAMQVSNSILTTLNFTNFSQVYFISSLCFLKLLGLGHDMVQLNLIQIVR